MENISHSDAQDLDIPKVFAQIRARYKVLCSIIGVKPSLRASQSHDPTNSVDDYAELRQSNNLWSAEIKQASGPADYSF